MAFYGHMINLLFCSHRLTMPVSTLAGEYAAVLLRLVPDSGSGWKPPGLEDLINERLPVKVRANIATMAAVDIHRKDPALIRRVLLTNDLVVSHCSRHSCRSEPDGQEQSTHRP